MYIMRNNVPESSKRWAALQVIKSVLYVIWDVYKTAACRSECLAKRNQKLVVKTHFVVVLSAGEIRSTQGYHDGFFSHKNVELIESNQIHQTKSNHSNRISRIKSVESNHSNQITQIKSNHSNPITRMKSIQEKKRSR